jgi:hypothetical protein
LINDAVMDDEVYEEMAGMPSSPHRRSSKDADISALGAAMERALERASFLEVFGEKQIRKRKYKSRIHEETVAGDLMWPGASGPWKIPEEVKRRVSKNLDREAEKLAERRQSKDMWLHHSGENNVLLLFPTGAETPTPAAGKRPHGPTIVTKGENVSYDSHLMQGSLRDAVAPSPSRRRSKEILARFEADYPTTEGRKIFPCRNSLDSGGMTEVLSEDRTTAAARPRFAPPRRDPSTGKAAGVESGFTDKDKTSRASRRPSMDFARISPHFTKTDNALAEQNRLDADNALTDSALARKKRLEAAWMRDRKSPLAEPVRSQRPAAGVPSTPRTQRKGPSPSQPLTAPAFSIDKAAPIPGTPRVSLLRIGSRTYELGTGM